MFFVGMIAGVVMYSWQFVAFDRSTSTHDLTFDGVGCLWSAMTWAVAGIFIGAAWRLGRWGRFK